MPPNRIQFFFTDSSRTKFHNEKALKHILSLLVSLCEMMTSNQTLVERDKIAPGAGLFLFSTQNSLPEIGSLELYLNQS